MKYEVKGRFVATSLSPTARWMSKTELSQTRLEAVRRARPVSQVSRSAVCLFARLDSGRRSLATNRVTKRRCVVGDDITMHCCASMPLEISHRNIQFQMALFPNRHSYLANRPMMRVNPAATTLRFCVPGLERPGQRILMLFRPRRSLLSPLVEIHCNLLLLSYWLRKHN